MRCPTCVALVGHFYTCARQGCSNYAPSRAVDPLAVAFAGAAAPKPEPAAAPKPVGYWYLPLGERGSVEYWFGRTSIDLPGRYWFIDERDFAAIATSTAGRCPFAVRFDFPSAWVNASSRGKHNSGVNTFTLSLPKASLDDEFSADGVEYVDGVVRVIQRGVFRIRPD